MFQDFLFDCPHMPLSSVFTLSLIIHAWGTDVGELSYASDVRTMPVYLTARIAICLAGWNMPAFIEGAGLRTLWCVCLITTNLHLSSLYSLFLTPQIISLLDCWFIGTNFETFLPHYKTGYFWRRGGFILRNILPVGLFDAPIFAKIYFSSDLPLSLIRAGMLFESLIPLRIIFKGHFVVCCIFETCNIGLQPHGCRTICLVKGFLVCDIWSLIYVGIIMMINKKHYEITTEPQIKLRS